MLKFKMTEALQKGVGVKVNTLDSLIEIENLRTIWAHEERDFSAWLAKEHNLQLLSDTIGVSISLEERESKVGNYSVDLYAYEDGTDRKIVIENQLEETDHDHLGKIITYASGKDAEIVIWIVKKSREEHQKAVEWLNLHMDSISFFLLEIKLWKIGGSLPAPKFDIIEQPNDWAKVMKARDTELTDTKKLQLDFWEHFADYAFNKDNQLVFPNQFSKRKARPQHWYNIRAGSSKYHISLTTNTQKNLIGAEIHFRDDKELFESFRNYQMEIDDILGLSAEWIEASKVCRILVQKEANIKSEKNSWTDYFDWFCKISVKLKEVIDKYDN